MAQQLSQKMLHLLQIRDPNNPVITSLLRIRRRLRRTDAKLREDYLTCARNPRLQIGGGWHILEGWLNTDLEAIHGVMQMDASQPFPFANGTFEYVYTEHMIEHVPPQTGAFMLRECHRVMRKGGVIRVVTPDLAAFAGLYSSNLCGLQQRYLSWFYDTFLGPGLSRTKAAAFDAMFRLWGHRFIYDEETLTGALRAAGFDFVERRRLGQSAHTDLQGIENTGRYPEGLLDFESLALEARK